MRRQNELLTNYKLRRRLTGHPPVAAVQCIPTLVKVVSTDIPPEIQVGELLNSIERYFAQVGTAVTVDLCGVFHQPCPRLYGLSVQENRGDEKCIRNPLTVFQFPVERFGPVPDRPLHQVRVCMFFRMCENRGFQRAFAVPVRLTSFRRDAGQCVDIRLLNHIAPTILGSCAVTFVDREFRVRFIPVGVVLFGRTQFVRQRDVPATKIVFASDIGFEKEKA